MWSVAICLFELLLKLTTVDFVTDNLIEDFITFFFMGFVKLFEYKNTLSTAVLFIYFPNCLIHSPNSEFNFLYQKLLKEIIENNSIRCSKF